MKLSRRSLMYIIAVFVFSLPFLSNGQSNHCAIKKSPFRMSMDSGKVLYAQKCMACHQADGLGEMNKNPPLDGKLINGEKSKLIEMVITGQVTHEETGGVKYENVMPANPDLNNQQVADVVTYIRNSFGNKASSVKASEVKSVRSTLKTNL